MSLSLDPEKTSNDSRIRFLIDLDGEKFYGTGNLGDCSRNDEMWEKTSISQDQLRWQTIFRGLLVKSEYWSMIIANLSVSQDALCALSWDFCDVGHFVEYWNPGHSDVHHILLLTRLEQLFFSVIVSHRDGYNALLLARGRQEFVALTSLR